MKRKECKGEMDKIERRLTCRDRYLVCRRSEWRVHEVARLRRATVALV